jgi:nicotinate-nucleotide pyrophosphorylase
MQIFGHEWIESEAFYPVDSIEEIEQTPPNSLLQLGTLPASLKVAKHCQANGLRYALEIDIIEEAIFANLLGATYVLANKALAKELMPIAQNYLFDTRVLGRINKNEIEEMAKSGVDGVVLV